MRPLRVKALCKLCIISCRAVCSFQGALFFRGEPMQDRLWQDYCRAIKNHHEKQTMETLIEALNSYIVHGEGSF